MFGAEMGCVYSHTTVVTHLGKHYSYVRIILTYIGYKSVCVKVTKRECLCH